MGRSRNELEEQMNANKMEEQRANITLAGDYFTIILNSWTEGNMEMDTEIIAVLPCG